MENGAQAKRQHKRNQKRDGNGEHQCTFRSTKYKEDGLVVPCRSKMARKRNVPQHHLQGKLRNVARPDGKNDEQTLPRINRSKEGTHEESKAGNYIHKKKPIANTADDGTRIKIEGETETLSEQPHTKENDVYFLETDMSETMHSDNTGPFPYISQWGKQIVMIVVHLDTNYIFAKTMRNKTDGE
jgi:hypothetical protein